MIELVRKSAGTYLVTMDNVDWIILQRLATAYGISSDAMFVGCINKGIEVIGKQIQQADRHSGSTNDHSQDELGG